MRRRGTPYRGLLYAGLCLTPAGLRVVEFNARFGDPETQVVLDRLDEHPAGAAAARRRGRRPGRRARPLQWRPGAAVVVVIAAEGYPEHPVKGDKIKIMSTERAGVPRPAVPGAPPGGRRTCCTRAPLQRAGAGRRAAAGRETWCRRAAGC